MKLLYLNHDGNIDDLVSLLLLLQAPNIRLIGVGVIGADSYVTPASLASRKIISHLSSYNNLQVAISNSRGVRQFPKEWRLTAYSFNDLPILNEDDNLGQRAKSPAHLDLIKKIKQAPKKVTLVMTGPLTDLARALSLSPEISKKIEKLYWMGGSMNGQGNVEEPGSDGTVEWNAFWDPLAVKKVFDAPIDIEIVSLDSTKQVPLTNQLRKHWAKLRKYPVLDLIGQGYALVHSFGPNAQYFLWDVLTALTSAYPDLVKVKKIKSNIKTVGENSGRTFLSNYGRYLNMVTDVSSRNFFQKIDYLGKINSYY